MTILKIARMGHPVLLEKAAPVTDIAAVQGLIRDMRDTLVDSGGIGLAAPQVHESQRVILVSVPDHRREGDEPAMQITALINPELEPIGEEKVTGWEGCLSIPGLRGAVPRWSAAPECCVARSSQTATAPFVQWKRHWMLMSLTRLERKSSREWLSSFSRPSISDR